MSGNGDLSRRLLLRTPVRLERQVVALMAARITSALGVPVRLVQRHDAHLHGVVIVLDERRQLEIDPRSPLRGLDEALERAREAAVDEEGVAGSAISALAGVTEIREGRTNLGRLLDGFRGDHVLLRTRVPVDEAVVARLADKLSAAAGRPLQVTALVDPRLRTGAVLQIDTERSIPLDTRYAWLESFERSLSGERGEAERGDVYEDIKRTIESSAPELRVEESTDSGTVLEVGDGIAVATGLREVGSQELLEFEGQVYGIAFNLLHDRVGCILLGTEESVPEGSSVRRTGHTMRVPVGPSLAGRIVDALGRPIDGKGSIGTNLLRPVERKAPGIVDRGLVEKPLQTGIKVIDALVPLGRGQRELVIGDRRIGKTTVALDTILAQKGAGVACIYASIGQKASTVSRVVRTLEEYGAMEYTTLVVSLSDEQPAFRYLAPYTACAIGEYFMDEGRDALVVYDDLSKHAVTYREVSALLKRPTGREAYPGDIFYLHSRLLERAARLSDDLGGGSLTALPIVETLAGDISAFIPTNVISICDGQIVLDTAAFNEGVRPAMNVGLSVSRVGGAAQTKAMKRVAGRLRMDLAQYQEMARFVKFGAEVDEATLVQLGRGERGRELLKQDQHAVMPPEEQIAVLYAVSAGLVDEVPVGGAREFERTLLDLLRRDEATLLAQIAESGELDAGLEERLRAAVQRSLRSFLSQLEARSPGEETVSAEMRESSEAEQAVV